jgi:hypothetical protein
MASLTNTKIKNTYVSLLKVADNGQLDAALQDITDGAGNVTGVQLNTGGDLAASGTVSFGSLKDTGENITISKFVDAADGIGSNNNDTTIPTSAAVVSYVAAQITAEDLDFAGDSGTGAVDLDSQTLTIQGTANEIETVASNQTLTIGLPSTINVNVTGDLTGNVTATSILQDGVIGTTQATSDNSTKVATTAFVKSVLTLEGLDIAGDSGTGAIDLDSQVLTVAGTANEVETSASGQTITVGLPSNVTIGNDLTVTTNATVGGTFGVTGATGVDGDFDVATNKFTVQAATGNTAVAGTLGVTGNTTLSTLDATGLASLDGGIDVDGAFTVADTSGNISTSGTLGVTGTSTLGVINASGLASLDAGIDVDGVFTVADTTGNVSTTGTLAVTGITTLTDDLAVDTDTLFVDVSTDRVGINKAVPTVALDVTGDITSSATITGVTLEGTLSATSVLADGVIATTQSTSDNSTKVATTAYVKSVVTAEDLDIAGDTGTGSIDLDSQTLTIAGTANEIETSASGQTITIGLPSTITANVTGNVAGDLTGTVLTAAQTNITSVGTLSSLAVSGNLTVDTNTLFVDAANNRVGVGTTSPLSTFHVNAGTDINLRVRPGTDVGAANGACINTRTDDDVSLNQLTLRASDIFLETSGAVGIGTFSPASLVNIAKSSDSGSGSVFPRLSVVNTLATQGDGSSTFNFSDLNISSGNGAVNMFVSTFYAAGAWEPGGQINVATNHPLIVKTNNTERMRIDSSGNVLIGTTSAISPLTVQGASDIRITVNESSNSVRTDLISQTAQGGVGTTSNHPFFIATNGSERMRITSGGYLKASNDASYVGSASAWHEINANHSGDPILIVHGSNGSYGGFGLQSRINRTSSGGNYSFFSAFDSAASVTRFVVHDDGDVENINNAYGALSDVKLKENIADASPKLDDLLKVKIRSYNLIENGFKQIGVIAQELEEVFPSMITEKADFKEVEVPQLGENGQEALDENGEVVITKERIELGTTTKSVKYSVFVPMLIKAMQEQQEIINGLKSRIETLEAK